MGGPGSCKPASFLPPHAPPYKGGDSLGNHRRPSKHPHDFRKSPNIYTVNPATGAATFLGDTGLGIAAVEGLDFNAAGALYAAVNIVGAGGTGADHLAIINKGTGIATVIGPFGSCTGVTIPSTGAGVLHY